MKIVSGAPVVATQKNRRLRASQNGQQFGSKPSCTNERYDKQTSNNKTAYLGVQEHEALTQVAGYLDAIIKLDHLMETASGKTVSQSVAGQLAANRVVNKQTPLNISKKLCSEVSL